MNDLGLILLLAIFCALKFWVFAEVLLLYIIHELLKRHVIRNLFLLNVLPDYFFRADLYTLLSSQSAEFFRRAMLSWRHLRHLISYPVFSEWASSFTLEVLSCVFVPWPLFSLMSLAVGKSRLFRPFLTRASTHFRVICILNNSRSLVMPRKVRHCVANLCLSLLLLCLTFTFGIHLHRPPLLCRIVGVALHYLSVCVPLWIAVTT